MNEKPFRLRVMDALAKGIAERVTPENGATNDLSEASFYGRSTYGDNDPLPMSSMIEDPREQETQGTVVAGKGHVVKWRLLVQGFVDDSSDNPTGPAYVLAADIMRGLAEIAKANFDRDDTVLGSRRKVNVIQEIGIGAPIVRPPDEFSSKAYCWIPLTLDLFETPSAPFT